MPAPEKNYSHKMLLFVGSSVVSFLLFEAALRVLELPVVAYTHQPCIYLQDKNIGYRYRPNSTELIHRNFEMHNNVVINSRGYHDVERRKSVENTRYILAIGDSFTAGIHVPTKNTWTQVLGKTLNYTDENSSIEVVNLGLDGTGTDIHVSLLKENLTLYRPEIVILTFYENDVSDVRAKKLYKECYGDYVLAFHDNSQQIALRNYIDNNRPNTFSRWLFENIYSFRLITNLYEGGILLRNNYISPSMIGMKVNTNGDTPRVILAEPLRELVKLSEQYGFELLVIPAPPKRNSEASIDELRNNIPSELYANLNVVDIEPFLNEELKEGGKNFTDLYWTYDGHFNQLGNELFGMAIKRVLDKLDDL